MKKMYYAIKGGVLFLLGFAALGGKAQAQLIMANGSGTICSGSFYDSGGSSGNYSNGENYVYTIYPTAGTVVQVSFGSLSVETCCDYLKIYNGNSTGATLVGTYTSSPGTIISTAADGSLTFQFHSDGSVTSTGWDAVVSCVAPCAGTPNPGNTVSTNPSPCPGSNFTLTLQNGNNGVGSTYQWQSSTDGSTYANVPTGGTGLTYTTTQTVATYYKCIVTCSNGGATATSAPLQVGIGPCINMGNGSTTTCGGTFFDSGGPGTNYSSGEDYVYTIYPNPGNFLRAVFTAFQVETCCDNLKIYNGNSTAAALIGTYTGSPGTVVSSAADGSLTFQFHSDGSVTSTGWEAALSCIPNPPCSGVPNLGTATASVSTICSGVNFTIGVQNMFNGSGVSYQWQSSPDGTTWSNVAGQTGTTFSGSQSQGLGYRLRAICATGPDTGYSTVAQVALTSFLNCFCTSNATSTVDEDILNVTFAGINNTSASNCNQYTDFTSIVGLGFQGLSYPISINTGDCENANFYNRRVSVYIDWNHNGMFTDAGELVFNPPYGTPAQTVLFTGSVDVPLTAVSGITRMRVICEESSAAGATAPCGTYTWGETEDYYLNVLPPPADEAGVLAITKPEIAACALGQQLWVNLQNLGTNDLTSANFVVKVNGLNIPVSNPWTGNVASQTTAEIQVPVTYSLADGDSVWIQVSLPNGVTEDSLLVFNNTISRRIYAGLSGVKTVYGGTADFADVNAAIQALQLRGVCDTVYFDIAANTYATQHIFLPYPEAGPNRLAVFESASGNAADVTFAFSGTGTANNYVFRFDGADGYMLRNLTGVAQGATYSTVVDIRNGSDDIILEGNTFMGDTAAAYGTGDFDRVVVASINATNDNRTVVRNNRIVGGNRGINLGGIGTGYETGVTIEGNTIEKFGYLGIILGNSAAYSVLNNHITPRTNLTQDAYGVYAVATIDGGNIQGNEIISNRTGGSVNLSNVKGGAISVWVSNNFLYQGDTNSTGLSYGVFINDANSSDIVLANNSISLGSDNTTAGAVTVVDGSQIRMLNNNIGAFGTAPAVRIEKSYSVSESDYNNLSGTSLMNYLAQVAVTLADVQTATGKDAHSVSVDPGFEGADLHTCAPALNGAAWPLAVITADFDGDARSATTPDIGADEFVGDANSLLAEDAFLKCPADQVTLGNTALDGVTYVWTPSGNTAQISTANAGTFIVTATSACGSFSDTATVVNKPLPTAGFTATSVGLAGIFVNSSTNATSYLWSFGDGNTSTDEDPTHVYASAGTYSVSLTVTNDCGTATFGPTPINVVNAGIEEAAGAWQVSLFPNPTDGQFTVLMNGLNNEATTVSVIDVTGKAVLLKNVPAGVNQLTLDATAFASGVYTVKIVNGDYQKVVRLVRK